jgi:hypothetical protein
VNRSLRVGAEESVLTVTVTAARPMVGIARLTAVIWVLDMNVTDAAGTEPNITVALEVNPMPVIVTDVPPAAGPLAGKIPDTET